MMVTAGGRTAADCATAAPHIVEHFEELDRERLAFSSADLRGRVQVAAFMAQAGLEVRIDGAYSPHRHENEEDYRFDPDARQTFAEYLMIRQTRPHFANAHSVWNALDRIRLRQALRPFEARATALAPDDLTTICEDDARASQLFDDEAAMEEDPR